MEGALAVSLLVALLALFIVYRTAVVVPQQSAYVVERLGRYHATMNAGFHILVPFVDVIRYRHTLKETAHDIAAQVCITRDNVQVGVDGILYLKVLNPERASYGISDYLFAITQLAQTTLRSEVGKIDLDRTFEERTTINLQVVGELAVADEAIPPGQYGRAQLRGSTWTVRNVGAQTTVAGERSRVVAVRGLELDIRPERGA